MVRGEEDTLRKSRNQQQDGRDLYQLVGTKAPIESDLRIEVEQTSIAE